MSVDGQTLPSGSRRSDRKVIVVILVVVAIGLAGFAVYFGYFGTSPGNDLCKSVANSPVVHDVTSGNGTSESILIVEADFPSPYAGINGSANEPANATWPIIRVHLGQTVSIHVVNCASAEAHGFQIQHFDDRTIIAIASGESYDITFTANQAGHFRIYCDILCAIHPLMQNGLLIVT